MEDPGAERRLAAILAADVVGYSRLMQGDDRATLAALTDCRALFAQGVVTHGGRIVNAPGDSILAEFPSALKAVVCADGIQAALFERNAAQPEARRMQFRIGVSLGDVLVDGAGVYGDGVNIAARLEAAAPPGGICVSKTVREQVAARSGLEFEDLGEHAVKNIAAPVHIFRIASRDAAGVAPPVKAPQRNSIAVLAFDNMSGDPEQEHFCDGISEDIITDLSKISGIAVISRKSSFVYKGQRADLRKVGKELGVRYVLEGSVRKAGDRIRINAQLIEVETGSHLWANRYDRKLDDVFLVGDEIAEEIVTSLDVKLGHGEETRVWRKAVASLPAREALNRGMEAYFLGTAAGYRKAREHFVEVIRLEPLSGWGYAQAALTHALEVVQGWSPDIAASLAEAKRLGDKAVLVDDTVAGGHGALSVVALFEGRHEDAIRHARQALEVRPMCAGPRAALAYTLLFSGRSADAIHHARDAVELNPLYPSWYEYLVGAAEYFAGQFKPAMESVAKAIAATPKLLPARLIKVASLMALGRDGEARQEGVLVCREFPGFSVAHFSATQPIRDPAQRVRYVEALLAAGLPA